MSTRSQVVYGIYTLLILMFVMFYFYTYGFASIPILVIGGSSKGMAEFMEGPLEGIALILTIILAVYLLRGKRYIEILSDHDKFDGWEEKYKTWALAVSLFADFCGIFPLLYI